jgi:3D (Asp-Asp-Asp) domain-containing protein
MINKTWYRKTIITIAIVIITLCVTALLIGYLEAKTPKPVEREVKVETVVKTKVVEVPVEVEVSEIDWQYFTITAYTADDAGCNNITAIGVDLDKAWVDYFTLVAIDPDVIPYGSTVYIDTEDEIIEALAVDTGGAIVGKRIDLLVESKEEAYRWGVRELRAGIIKS